MDMRRAWLVALISIASVAPLAAQTRVAIPQANPDASTNGSFGRTPTSVSIGGQAAPWRTASNPTPISTTPITPPTATPGSVTPIAPTTPVGAPAAMSPTNTGVAPIEPLKPINRTPRPTVAKVTPGTAVLPNEQGQVWREYDLTQYTSRVSSTQRPEQALVDWILRETGYEAWHGEPLGILSANAKTLRVYHTPEMQATVADVVDRFVNSEAATIGFSFRLATLASPNWRIQAQNLLHPVTVQSPGIQAWLLQKEEAALLLAELRKRMDYREHSAPQLIVNNGQSAAVAVGQAKSYVRNLIARPGTAAGYDTDVAQFNEGFNLEIHPLLSVDGRAIDAVVKCNVDQLERLIPVMLDVPAPMAPRQRLKIDVPQISQLRMHERFRWPADQVLIIGMGMVAPPTPTEPGALMASLPLVSQPARADLLVFIESRGRLSSAAAAATTASPIDARKFGGRY